MKKTFNIFKLLSLKLAYWASIWQNAQIVHLPAQESSSSRNKTNPVLNSLQYAQVPLMQRSVAKIPLSLTSSPISAPPDISLRQFCGVLSEDGQTSFFQATAPFKNTLYLMFSVHVQKQIVYIMLKKKIFLKSAIFPWVTYWKKKLPKALLFSCHKKSYFAF